MRAPSVAWLPASRAWACLQTRNTLGSIELSRQFKLVVRGCGGKRQCLGTPVRQADQGSPLIGSEGRAALHHVDPRGRSEPRARELPWGGDRVTPSLAASDDCLTMSRFIVRRWKRL